MTWTDWGVDEKPDPVPSPRLLLHFVVTLLLVLALVGFVVFFT